MVKDEFIKSLNELVKEFCSSEDYSIPKIKKEWVHWFFVGWWAISLGIHISLKHANIEIHLPFGFLTISFRRKPYTYYAVSINV